MILCLNSLDLVQTKPQTMKSFFTSIALMALACASAQEKSKSDKLLKELSENACKCIDSVSTNDAETRFVAGQIKECIDEQAGAYQMSRKLMDIDVANSGQKSIEIEFNVNKDSPEYKKYYYEIERELMASCAVMKEKIGSNNKYGINSMTKNPKALELYNEGTDLAKSGDQKGAIKKYKKAIELDAAFAFAYDNMGIAYRRLDDYDNAIKSYEKSLEINPEGTMPLQNLAIVYQYKKDYPKAITYYEKLAKIDDENPEVFYGIGNVQMITGDYEKSLDNMCKAYNLYVEHGSPYRSDAEKIINILYAEMKKQGKEKRFNEILEQNKISQN